MIICSLSLLNSTLLYDYSIIYLILWQWSFEFLIGVIMSDDAVDIVVDVCWYPCIHICGGIAFWLLLNMCSNNLKSTSMYFKLLSMVYQYHYILRCTFIKEKSWAFTYHLIAWCCFWGYSIPQAESINLERGPLDLTFTGKYFFLLIFSLWWELSSIILVSLYQV